MLVPRNILEKKLTQMFLKPNTEIGYGHFECFLFNIYRNFGLLKKKMEKNRDYVIKTIE